MRMLSMIMRAACGQSRSAAAATALLWGLTMLASCAGVVGAVDDPVLGPIASPTSTASQPPPTSPAQAAVAPVWPASDTPVEVYLAELSPRQLECMRLMFERQNASVDRISSMDAYPATKLLEWSKARCETILARTDPARLRSDVRCTLDLPGDPVSRCEEAFVRIVRDRSERLAPYDALRAEVEALGDPTRRVAVARFERADAAAERLGARAALEHDDVAQAPMPVRQVPAPLEAATTPPAPEAAGPIATAPTTESSIHVPAKARFVVFVTCGPVAQHLRVQDCFVGSHPTTLEVRRPDGSRRVYASGDLPRAGPTGKDGLGLELDEPFEVSARNASGNLLLGLRVVDRQSGRTIFHEQAGKDQSVTARR
jgi:hypothetical protein